MNNLEVATQAGVPITNSGGSFNDAAAVSAGFNEPLTATQVLAIVDNFIV